MLGSGVQHKSNLNETFFCVQGVLRDLSKNIPVAGGQQPHILQQQQVSYIKQCSSHVLCVILLFVLPHFSNAAQICQDCVVVIPVFLGLNLK